MDLNLYCSFIRKVSSEVKIVQGDIVIERLESISLSIASVLQPSDLHIGKDISITFCHFESDCAFEVGNAPTEIVLLAFVEKLWDECSIAAFCVPLFSYPTETLENETILEINLEQSMFYKVLYLQAINNRITSYIADNCNGKYTDRQMGGW